MGENKLDRVFTTLSNNTALYQQLISAVEEEVVVAMNNMHTSAVRALYHPEEVPQACGQGGIYHAWDGILNRLRRIQNNRSGL